MKLVYKILFAIVIPIAILSTIFILFIHNILYNEVETRFLQNLENTTIDYASLLNLKLENISEMVSYSVKKIEQSPELTQSQIVKLIKETITYDSLIYGVSVFYDSTYTGKLKGSFHYGYRDSINIVNVNFNHNDIAYQDYFSQNFSWWTVPKKTKQPIWTSPYYDDGAGNQLIITYARPFFVDGVYSGIITVDILLEKIKELLLINEKRIEGDYNPELYVINASDSVLIYAERNNIIGMNAFAEETDHIVYNLKAKLSIFDLILNIKSGPGIIKDNMDQSYFVFHSNVHSCNWVVVELLNVTRAKSFVSKSINNVIIIIIIFLLSIVIIIFSTSRLITSPLSKLSALTIEISKGNYKKEIPTKRNDEIGMLATNFKVMTSKLLERENSLKEANKQLLVLDEAKNDFLKLISHEIRTPLNGIVGSAYFLKDMIQDPELIEFLEMLKESVDRLDKFSRTALEITEMQTVGNNNEKSSVDISDIVKSTISMYNEQLTEKSITVKTSFCDQNSINAVEQYLKRSIEELIYNAIKYSHSDTVIEIKTFVENDKLKLQISDTGEVIAKEKIKEIIKPFGLGSEHYDKTIGLGLTYIQKFLDLHNASMDIVSNIDKTVFTLIFTVDK